MRGRQGGNHACVQEQKNDTDAKQSVCRGVIFFSGNPPPPKRHYKLRHLYIFYPVKSRFGRTFIKLHESANFFLKGQMVNTFGFRDPPVATATSGEVATA